jgi:hypothetical protein
LTLIQLADTLFVEKKEAREVGLSERFTLVYKASKIVYQLQQGTEIGWLKEI